MSRYKPSTPNIRNMSIYSTRKDFETPTDELNFAKDYNKKTNIIYQNRYVSFIFLLLIFIQGPEEVSIPTTLQTQ